LNKVKEKKKPQNTMFKVNFLKNTKRKKNKKRKFLKWKSNLKLIKERVEQQEEDE